MKRTLLLSVVFLFCGVNINAQLKVGPTLSLDYSGVNVGDSSASGKFSLNPEVIVKYCFSEKWAVGVGTGYRRVKTNDYGRMSAAPVFASVLYGKDLGVDFNVGYMVPINSTATPVLCGPFVRIGGYIRTDADDGDEVVIGGHVDIFNVTGSNKIPTYIPDGYGPIVSGISLGLYLQYAFSVER